MMSGTCIGLAVILVGERRDSKAYVGAKKKACAEIGVASFGFDYPGDVDQAVIIDKVMELNADPAVHGTYTSLLSSYLPSRRRISSILYYYSLKPGILVQLPLPPHIDETTVLNAIAPEKDVDGLHPINVAKLAKTSTRTGAKFSLDEVDFHIACTPQGCIELLERHGVDLTGKNAVVLGRSNIVGIPVALLLMHKNATVTIAHSRTHDLPGVLGRADIVVAAVGRPEMVKGAWIKPGCVLIDVGINSVDDPTDKRGYRLVGDAEFSSCKEVASQITPVPGGVGPMTIAMLLKNTVAGARRSAAGPR
jgi:5,10-methylene-tetrahydrofolate dehydrogenase/methenyl tetrahydrofolate cyclohydrolase